MRSKQGHTRRGRAVIPSATCHNGDMRSIGRDGGASARAAARRRTIHALVSGRVQGVGFRWSCMEEGERLGLVGEVRNLPDGDVEVLAQGPADDVARLIAWLYRGPRWASVSAVVITDLEPGSLRKRAFIMGN